MNRALRGLIRRYTQLCVIQCVPVKQLHSCHEMQLAADNHDLEILDEAVCDHALDFNIDMENPPELFAEIYDKIRAFRG